VGERSVSLVRNGGSFHSPQQRSHLHTRATASVLKRAVRRCDPVHRDDLVREVEALPTITRATTHFDGEPNH
jgi:hypothetical protein